MSVPTYKHSKGRRDRRRLQDRIRLSSLAPCPQCKQLTLPHRVCPACGSYDGRQVVAVEAAQPKKRAAARAG